MAIRETSIKLSLDSKSAEDRIKTIQAKLNDIEKKKYKINLDIDDKKLKSVANNLNSLKNIKFGSNAEALTSQFSRLETVSQRFTEQLGKGAKASILSGTSNQIDGIVGKIQKLNQQQVGDLFKNASSSINSFRSGVDSVASSLGSLLAKAAAVGAGLAAAFAVAGKKALDFIGDQQRAFQDNVILLGDNEEAARRLGKALNEFDVKSPFDIGSLNQLANVLAVSIPDADELALKVKQLADVSGGSFEKAQRAAVTLQQVFSKGFLDTRDFRELTTSAPALAKELQKLGAGTQEGLKIPLDKVNAALDTTTDGFKRTEVAARTIPGLLSSIKSQGQRLTAALFGVDLTEGFKIKEGGLADKIQKTLAGIIDNTNIQPAILKFGNSISDGLAAAFGGIDPGAVSEKIVKFLESASQKVPGIINTIVTQFKRISSEVTPILKTATTFIGGFFEKIGGGDKVKGAILAVEGLVKAFIGLKVLSPILGGLSSAFSIIGTIAGGGKLSGLLGIIQGLGGGGAGLAGIASGFGALGSALAAAAPWILAIGAALGILYLGFKKIQESDFLKGIVNSLIKPLSSAFDSLKEALSRLWEAIKPAVEPLKKVFETIGAGAIIGAIGVLAGALTILAGALTWVVDTVTRFVDGFKKLMTGDLSGIKDMILSPFTGLGDAIKDLFNFDLGAFITEKLTAMGSAISTFFTETIPSKFNELTTIIGEKLVALGAFLIEKGPALAGYAIGWIISLPFKAIAALGLLLFNIGEWFVNTLIPNLITWGANALESAIQWFTQLPGRITEWLINMYNTVQDWFTKTGDDGKTKVQNFIDSVINFFKELPGKILSAIGSLVSVFQGWIDSAVDVGARIASGIVSGIGDLGGKISSKIGSFVEGLKSGITAGFETGGVIPQYRRTGGLIYASRGYTHPGNPRGSDTVPAWLTPGEGVIRRSSMASIGKNMFNDINKRGSVALKDIFNSGFQAGNTYNNKTANTTVNITNNNPGAAISSMLGLDRRINNAIA